MTRKFTRDNFRQADEILLKYSDDLLRLFFLENELYYLKNNGDIHAQQYDKTPPPKIGYNRSDRVFFYVHTVITLENEIKRLKLNTELINDFISELHKRNNKKSRKYMRFFELFYIHKRTIREISIITGKSRQVLYKIKKRVRDLFTRFLARIND